MILTLHRAHRVMSAKGPGSNVRVTNDYSWHSDRRSEQSHLSPSSPVSAFNRSDPIARARTIYYTAESPIILRELRCAAGLGLSLLGRGSASFFGQLDFKF